MLDRNISNQDIRLFILQWNKQYPIDFWWRKKYNVPFGSKKHLEMNHLDMLIDYEEEKLFEEIREQHKRQAEIKENEELGLKSLSKDIVPMSSKEIDEEFENLDLSQFKDTPDIKQDINPVI